MARGRAKFRLRVADDESCLVRFFRVGAAGAVARLALHVLKGRVHRDGRATGLFVAGHVAAHALEVELFDWFESVAYARACAVLCPTHSWLRRGSWRTRRRPM